MNEKTIPTARVPEREALDALIAEFEVNDTMEPRGTLADLMNGLDSENDVRKKVPSKRALDELMDMEGLDEVKTVVQRQLSYAKIMKIRQELGFRAPRRIMHFIFTGNPGVGKTTVARLIGEIFHQAGLLSTGHTVETNRAGLVGRYIGESEANTTAKIAEARGGVLFIDEIYALTSEVSGAAEETRDFGIKVLDTLMPVLSDPESDLIVVGAGYLDNMRRFLKANPGLASRFPIVLDFEDFTTEQIWSIARKRLEEFDFTVSEDGEEAVRRLIDEAKGIKDFGNGRFAVTLVEDHVIPTLCERIEKAWQTGIMSAARMRQLSVVEPADIPSIETLFPLTGKKRAALGFR